MQDEEIVEGMEVTDEGRSKVSRLAELQRVQIKEVAEATVVLREKLNNLDQTMRVALPNAMRDIGMSEFKLLDGTRVKLDTRYIGFKLEDKEGLKWVEDHGGSSLIRTEISIQMDRGDIKAARELFQELRRHKFANRFKEFELRENVHNATIGAFVRELVEQGKDVPFEKLGVRHEVSTIVGPRRPKTIELKGIVLRKDDED